MCIRDRFDNEKLHSEQRMGAKTCFSFLMIHVGSGSSEQHLEGTTANRSVISLLVTDIELYVSNTITQMVSCVVQLTVTLLCYRVGQIK